MGNLTGNYRQSPQLLCENLEPQNCGLEADCGVATSVWPNHPSSELLARMQHGLDGKKSDGMRIP